jgi:hypothetical protein
VDVDLAKEIETIYETYQTYQADIEPLTFFSGIGEARTENIYREVTRCIGPSDHGLMVDG